MKVPSSCLLAACLLACAVAMAQDDSAQPPTSPAARYWDLPRLEFNPHAGRVSLPQTNAVRTRTSQLRDLTIQNEFLEVRLHAGAELFSVLSKTTGRAFLTNVSFNRPVESARIQAVSDTVFGPGTAIEIACPDGSADAVALHQRLPFALFRSTQRNPGSQPIVVRSARTLRADASLGRSLPSLRTLGTGGLASPGKDPGSYCWLAVADPATRNAVIFGALTHERGDTVFFSHAEQESARIGTQLDYGRLRIEPGESADLETIAVGWFEDGRLGLEAWADAVARVYHVQLPSQPAGYCTWYSRPHGGASDETHLAELSRFAAQELAPYGFSVVQIDDGWQAGVKRSSPSSPKKDFTTHNPNGPYPGGMKAAADSVKSTGLVPGIWFMPFAGTVQDPFFQKHRDWFVRTPSGEPYDTPWGGTSLDMTHPGARAHLREVAGRIGHEWGFGYIKIDGLWTGTATKQLYVNSGFKEDDIGDAVFHDVTKSNIEAYRDGLKLVREAVGPAVFILGCNGPQNMRSYGGAFGLVDGMRVGPDNGSEWKSLVRGPMFGSRHYFLHGRVWYNDPDPVYVRPSMPLKHAQLICSWVALSDQLNLSSEWLPGLPPERLDVLKRTMPYHHRVARPVDYFEHDPPRIWLVTDDQQSTRRDVIGLFNWNDSQQDFDYPLEYIGLDPAKEYAAYDFWDSKLGPTLKDRLQVAVPAQSCLVLAVRAKANHPQVLSTSRHVTQGMMDLSEERWDASTKTLSARSKIIRGDTYEVRIAGASAPSRITLDAGSREAGATATLDLIGELLRLRITSLENRNVTWTVQFQ